MAKRIPFSVIQVSGEDPGHLATNLSKHGPNSRGWITSRNCRYPQELILSVKTRTKVTKIQLLSHPYLISSRIDVYCADDATSRQASSFGFQRVGHVVLSDNAKSEYAARELKSILMSANASLIKLTFHNNFSNEKNTHKQIGVVAINIIGKPLETLRNQRKHALKSLLCVDDLTFRMYQDPEVAQIIATLEEKRMRYYNDNQMEEAKSMKHAVDELMQGGLVLGKKGIDHHQAKLAADFTNARQIEKDMESYRMSLYDKLQHEISLCLPGAKSRYDRPKVVEPLPMRREPEPVEQNDPDEDESEDELKFAESTPSPAIPTPEPELIINEPEKSPEPEAMSPQPEAAPLVQSHDEMVLPALKNKAHLDYGQMFADESGGDNGKAQEEEEAAKPKTSLSKKEQQLASDAIEVFGNEVIELAYSKNFKSREEAIAKIKVHLKLYEAQKADHNASVTMKAATFMMHKFSKDKVLSVFNVLVELMEFVFNQFVPRHKIQRSDCAVAIDKIVPELVVKLGDTAPRMRTAAEKSILRLSLSSSVQPLKIVPQHILQPFKNNNIPQKLALGRCQLVDKLIRQRPLSENKDITVRQIMAFCLKALEHTSANVREITEAITLLVYEQRGSEVRPCLPPDNEQTRKKPAFKRLFEKFDELDMEEHLAMEDGQNEILALRNELAKVQSNLNTRSAISVRHAAGENQSIVDLREGTLSRLNNSTLDLKDARQDAPETDFQKTCIFCGEQDEAFSNEGLETHYMKDCPMLMCCKYCNQVVEVSGLVEHHLTECDKKDDFKQCERCLEAIPSRKYNLHVKVKTCPAVKKDDSHCPLCHQKVDGSEDGWKQHLTGAMECAFNPRRKNNPLSKS